MHTTEQGRVNLAKTDPPHLTHCTDCHDCCICVLGPWCEEGYAVNHPDDGTIPVDLLTRAQMDAALMAAYGAHMAAQALLGPGWQNSPEGWAQVDAADTAQGAVWAALGDWAKWHNAH